MKEYVVGLDVGTTKIAVVAGERMENGKIRVIGFANEVSYGVINGQVENVQEASDAIKRAVAEVGQQVGKEIKHVVLGIAGRFVDIEPRSSTITKVSTASKMIAQEDVDELLTKVSHIAIGPSYQIVQIIPQDYKVDTISDRTTNPVGVIGDSLEGRFLIVSANMQNLASVNMCVEMAGLIIDGYVLEPIASARAVLTADELEAGVAVVDIGGGTTDIAIFVDNILQYTKVISLGGESITGDIKTGCNITSKQAESFKINHGRAYLTAKENVDLQTSGDNVAKLVFTNASRERSAVAVSYTGLIGIIQARMNEILNRVLMEVQNSGCENNLHSNFVFTGGGSKLKGTAEFAELKLGKSVRIATPELHLADGTNNVLKDPIYSTAIGLVMMGFDLEDEKDRKEQNTKKVAEPSQEQNEDTDKKPFFTKLHDGFSNFFKGITEKFKD